MNAAREIATKSKAQINKETARTWAQRALAYCRAARRAAQDSARAAEYWAGYDDARHEALEHAALAEDQGKTVARYERLLNAAKNSTQRLKQRRR